MEIKHCELSIPPNNPFENCKLGRQRYAQVLTEIVQNYADGFVMAVNNDWGTGKTTFIKMWQQHLENAEIKTIYFNAWENDFDMNPLVAIMSELQTLKDDKSETTFKSILDKGTILVKNIAPALLKAIANKYIDSEILVDAIENTAKGASEILEKEISEYTNKKKTIKDFRNELEKFVQQISKNKPLVFFIDELDRCRPDYAVELLEQMKHFFSVSGIVFVLSIDKKHLAGSVKGFYGSESINTDEYLRRFIDLEYSLPAPNIKEACIYFIKYFSLWGNSGLDTLLEISSFLSDRYNTSLRQMEKIFAHTRIVVSAFHPNNNNMFTNLLFYLIFIKTIKPEFYSEICNNSFELQTLCEKFEETVTFDGISECEVNLLHLEAQLLLFYNNSRYPYRDKVKLFVTDGNNLTSVIRSKLDKEGNKFAGYLRHATDYWNASNIKLSYLTNKIDLLENMQQ